MIKVVSVVSHAIDLSDGRVLAPGETCEIKGTDPHDKALLEEGSVLEVAAEDPKPKPSGKTPRTREDSDS